MDRPGPLSSHCVRERGRGGARPRKFVRHVRPVRFVPVVGGCPLPHLTEQPRVTAQRAGVAERVTTAVHDVRDPLRLSDASVDALFAHMLLCMALSTEEIRALVGEVRRVLRPGGVFVYTVRHTGDAHYRVGTAHGDGIFEHGGFAVHFFHRALANVLAEGVHQPQQ